MKKSIKINTLVLVGVVTIMLSSITVFATSQNKLIFKNPNGDDITFTSNNPQDFATGKSIVASDTESVEIGQTIQVNGEDVIVFAVAEDGSCITVTPEMYYEFKASNP